MHSPQKILICPLNWGLGHASRCVPIVHNELQKGNEVIIAGDGYPLRFLQQQFPYLNTVELPSYKIKYSGGKSQLWAMLRFLPQLTIGILREKKWLQNFIQSNSIDTIISDNRFGLYNKHIHSIYVSHQIMIKMPSKLRFLEPIAYQWHKRIIEKFDECWIPDLALGNGLSGDLSHKYPIPSNAKFIGILSRFSGISFKSQNSNYKRVIIVSGVEPQRTIFEKWMCEKYRSNSKKTLLIQGLPSGNKTIKNIGNISIMPHLPDEELASALVACTEIICRAGYSTIMDLWTLDCLHKAVFIPTPGQTEQEYLACYHSISTFRYKI